MTDMIKEAYDRLDAQKLEPITEEDRKFIEEMKGRMPHLSIRKNREGNQHDHVRFGPRPDGFYNDAERDAFQEKQIKALTEVLNAAMSRPPLKMGEFTIGRGGRIIEKSK